MQEKIVSFFTKKSRYLFLWLLPVWLLVALPGVPLLQLHLSFSISGFQNYSPTIPLQPWVAIAVVGLKNFIIHYGFPLTLLTPV